MAEILIIGGGMSGLSAGIYGLLSGHSVTVCEKNRTSGGNLTGWYRDGYYIDNCIHWLTGTNPNTEYYKMWKTLGVLGGTGIYRPESLYTCGCCGITLSLYRDIERLESEMLSLSHVDERETAKLIKAVKAIQKAEGIGGAAHNEKSTAAEKAASLPLLMKYRALTVGGLAERFRHPLLRKFLSSFIPEYFGALALIFIFAEFCGNNADCPYGGSLAAAKRVERRFKELGGRLLLNKEAVRINVKNGAVSSVSFSDKDTIGADHFIAAADPYYVFDRLTSLPLPEALAKQRADNRYSRFSSCHAAFAFDGAELPFSYDAAAEIPRGYQSALGAGYMSLREFSHEPSFAPEGKTVIQTAVFCGETASADLIALKNDGEEYKRKKESIAHCMLKSAEAAFPKLKNRLTLLDVWTPSTYRDYFNSESGSYMGYAFSSGVTPKLMKNRVDGADNLILATQWQRSPGGLPNAAYAGKLAIDTVNASSGSGRRRIAAVKYGEAAAGTYKE